MARAQVCRQNDAHNQHGLQHVFFSFAPMTGYVKLLTCRTSMISPQRARNTASQDLFAEKLKEPMKSILVADNRSELLATLEPILKHWGYRVLSTRKASQVMTFLRESAPCLLIIGEAILADPELALDADMLDRLAEALPIVALKQEVPAAEAPLIPSETLEVPLGLFELFSFIQRKVENYPRHNLRLRLRLPGMYSIDNNNFILAEILNLSMHGLFFKAAARVKKGDRVTVVFPLLGQGKEIEVKATVLYVVQPEAKNNFFQGFAVGFDDGTENQRQDLQQFIREHFLKEVSTSRNGVGDFAAEQLKS
jgi:CheY-like chemotaxis protein